MGKAGNETGKTQVTEQWTKTVKQHRIMPVSYGIALDDSQYADGHQTLKGRLKMKDTEELIKDLKHKDSSVRQHAAETLGSLGDEKAVDSLILALKDKNKFVRQEVVSALGKIGGQRLLEPLTQALKEEKDDYVKSFINKVLDKLQK